MLQVQMDDTEGWEKGIVWYVFRHLYYGSDMDMQLMHCSVSCSSCKNSLLLVLVLIPSEPFLLCQNCRSDNCSENKLVEGFHVCFIPYILSQAIRYGEVCIFAGRFDSKSDSLVCCLVADMIMTLLSLLMLDNTHPKKNCSRAGDWMWAIARNKVL